MPAPSPQSAEALISQILGLSEERQRISDEESMQAQAAYQQAEAAPVEQPSTLATSIGTAGNRLATTLAGPGGPNYSQQFKTEQAAQASGAAKARTDNITRLRDTYEKAAARAAKMGDSDAEVKARVALKKIDEQMETEKRDAAMSEWDRQNRIKFGQDKELEGMRAGNRMDLKQTPSATQAEANTPEGIASIGQRLVNGDIESWSQVPKEIRTQVSQWVDQSGQTVLTKKGREASGKLNALSTALGEIRALSEGVNTANGPARFGQGIKNAAEGFLRNTPRGLSAAELKTAREQYLPIFARAMGEVGNLADQEQKRQLRALPDDFTDAASAKRWLDRAERVAEELRQKAIKTYSQPMAGMGGVVGGSGSAAAPTKGGDPLGIR